MRENVDVGKEISKLAILHIFQLMNFFVIIDNVNFCYFKLLHAILPPSSNMVKGKRLKYTIADSQVAFTIEVSSASEIENLNVDRSQPTICAVGTKFNFKQFIVLFDASQFVFKTCLSAVDFCFKIFNIYNLSYVEKCTNVWVFVQHFCYDLPIKNKNPPVQTFINDIFTHISNDK